jgi:hypothetical protein
MILPVLVSLMPLARTPWLVTGSILGPLFAFAMV